LCVCAAAQLAADVRPELACSARVSDRQARTVRSRCVRSAMMSAARVDKSAPGVRSPGQDVSDIGDGVGEQSADVADAAHGGRVEEALLLSGLGA
jgi:hypothetical protein